MTPQPETIIANRLMHLDSTKRAIEQAREMISELKLLGYRIVAFEDVITITRSEFVDLVAAALIEAVDSSSAISRLHQSTARYIAASTFDRAIQDAAAEEENT